MLSGCDSFKSDMRADTANDDEMIQEWARRVSADGVVGITRGFMAAGALTVMASLWKVDDDATRLLMNEFYARLMDSSSQRDAARALQGAMRVLIAQGRPAVHWAAFVSYGLWSWDPAGPGREADLEPPTPMSRTSSVKGAPKHGNMTEIAQDRESS